jgi:hypothetical protein
MPEVGFGYSDRVALEEMKDRMKSITGGGGPLHDVIDFSSVDCCEGFVESCSIFLFDSRKIGQSLVWWSVSLPWHM